MNTLYTLQKFVPVYSTNSGRAYLHTYSMYMYIIHVHVHVYVHVHIHVHVHVYIRCVYSTSTCVFLPYLLGPKEVEEASPGSNLTLLAHSTIDEK